MKKEQWAFHIDSYGGFDYFWQTGFSTKEEAKEESSRYADQYRVSEPFKVVSPSFDPIFSSDEIFESFSESVSLQNTCASPSDDMLIDCNFEDAIELEQRLHDVFVQWMEEKAEVYAWQREDGKKVCGRCMGAEKESFIHCIDCDGDMFIGAEDE